MLDNMYGKNFISNRRFYLSKISNIGIHIRLLTSSRSDSINIHIARKYFIATPQIEFNHQYLKAFESTLLLLAAFLVNGSDEIVRTPFHIDVDPADVLAQHADANQLNSPKEQNSHDQ